MEKTAATKMVVLVLVLGALLFAATMVEGVRSIKERKEEEKYEPETFGNFFGNPGGIGGAPGFGQPGVGSFPGYQPGFGSIPGSQPGFGSFPGFGNGPVMPGGGLGGDNGVTTP